MTSRSAAPDEEGRACPGRLRVIRWIDDLASVVTRGPDVARVFLVSILMGIVVSCPILCGTVEASLHAPNGTHVPSSGREAPVPHPINDDDCFCNGAIKADDSLNRHFDFDLDGLSVPVESPFVL